MRDDLIHIELGQQAVVECDDMSTPYPSVLDAYMAWAQLELDEKERAIIQVGEERFGIAGIRRFRFEPVAQAA
jgi:hypothetical protein